MNSWQAIKVTVPLSSCLHSHASCRQALPRSLDGKGLGHSLVDRYEYSTPVNGVHSGKSIPPSSMSQWKRMKNMAFHLPFICLSSVYRSQKKLSESWDIRNTHFHPTLNFLSTDPRTSSRRRLDFGRSYFRFGRPLHPCSAKYHACKSPQNDWSWGILFETTLYISRVPERKKTKHLTSWFNVPKVKPNLRHVAASKSCGCQVRIGWTSW